MSFPDSCPEHVTINGWLREVEEVLIEFGERSLSLLSLGSHSIENRVKANVEFIVLILLSLIFEQFSHFLDNMRMFLSSFSSLVYPMST